MGRIRTGLAVSVSTVAVVAAVFSDAVLATKEPSFDFCPPGSLGGQCNAPPNGPRGVAVNESGAGGVAAGTIYISDFNNRRIQAFDADGNFVRAWGWDVIAPGQSSDSGTGFEICQVAAECKAGTSGGGAGQFVTGGLAGGSAVNQTSGHVYVFDRNNRRVQEFDASGHFVRMWGADVDSVNPSTGFEVCEVPANCKAGANAEASGSGAGMFATPNGALAGIGADSAGNIYVADGGNSRVQKFSATGTPLRVAGWDVVETGPGDDTTADPGEDEFEVCVPANGDTCKAGAAGGNEKCQFGGQNPWQLATSPAGDVYTVDQLSSRIYRLNSALACPDEHPFAVAALEEGGGPRGLAVDALDGHLFVANLANEFIYEIDPATEEEVDKVIAGASNWSGLAVNSLTGRLYGVAGSLLASGNFIRAFDEVVVLEVETNPATEISGTEARLNGTVTPNGSPVTECAFEYDTNEYEEGGEEHGVSVPCEEPDAGEVGEGSTPVAVHADISELDPGTTYHFVLRAGNDDEEKESAEEEFDTLGPAMVESWSEGVGFTEATLAAEINPKGSATTYHFEYGTLGPCSANPCTSVPIPDGEVGDDSSIHKVSMLLSELTPGATYNWRVVATNADETTVGPDHSLLTYAQLDPEPCVNYSFRVAPSANLPDCRAYEMVSPPDKNGGDIVAAPSLTSNLEAAYRQSSLDGNRITYSSTTAFGDSLRSSRSNQYMASRSATGWSTHSLLPVQGRTVFDPESDSDYDLGINFQGFSPDLCIALVRDHNFIPLTEEAIAGFTNLYLRDNCGPGAGTYQPVTIGGTPQFSVSPIDLFPQGRNYSSDFSHVVFRAPAALNVTPPPAAAENTARQVYEFSGGELHLVSVLPNGNPNPDSSRVASGEPERFANLSRAVSEDGSRIFWSSESGGGSTLYVRVDLEETLQIAAPSGGKSPVFWGASVDGTIGLFSQEDDSENVHLYFFDVDKGLAEEAALTEIAAHVGGVIGASGDLSRIFFTSEEAIPGAGQNGFGEGADEGKRNIYLWDEGAIRFVATLAAADSVPLGGSEYAADASIPLRHSARVSADGRRLGFMSTAPLTGYDNTDLGTGEAASEIYHYDADANGGAGVLLCVSCNPSGARPRGAKVAFPYVNASLPPPTNLLAAAWLPTWEWSNYAKRSVPDNADRIFFNSFDALVPEDENGVQDVYQWEAAGTGTCTTADPRYFPRNGGCLHLISTGKSKLDSEFTDASADGSDVFITTGSSIDPGDLGSIDVYDARAGGGFPPPPPPKPPCVGDACQSVPAPPSLESPTSGAYRGPGNVSDASKGRCAKGKVRREGRCVKRRHQKSHKRIHRRADTKGVVR